MATIGEEIFAALNQSKEPSLYATTIDSWMPRIEKQALLLEPRLAGDDLYQVKFQLGMAEAHEFLGMAGDSWKSMAKEMARTAGKKYDNAKQTTGLTTLRGQGDADIVTVVDVPDFLWDD